MIGKGVLEIVPDTGPGFYSRLFLVEKASGGWRPVYRPLSSERIHPADPVQDGNPKFRPLSSQRERLPCLHRPQGRVLPGTRTSHFQEATSIRLKRQGLPVQGTVLRPLDRPTGVQEVLRGRSLLGLTPRESDCCDT